MKISFGIVISTIAALAAPAQAASLDPTFGSAGTTSTAFDYYGSAARVVIQPDGRIVTAGQDALGAFTLARYTTSGALDTSFNGTGKITTTPSSSCSGQARALALQADGKIVVAGTSCPNFNSTRNFTIYRYNTDGSLDSTFGSSGKATVNFSAGASEAYAVAVQGSSIWVAGYAGSNFALARLTSSGTLDYSFGSGSGTVTSAVGTSSASASSLVIQADGKPVLAGYASSGGTVFALTRYTTNGALDTTFGVGGKVLTNVAGTFTGNFAFATSLAIQSDGNIVAAGYANSTNTSYYRFAAVRYTSTGALDSTFGSGTGKVITAIGSNDAIGNDVAIDANGGIIIGGYSSAGSQRQLTLNRYDQFGNQDYSFGPVATTVGSANAAIEGIAIQADGKIVVAGYGNSPVTFVVARYQ
ncbi:delta-60 repeat domain-containing protein [Dyella silvatica]|uniref:delta-60 repeat domain-containing protein n=1 Tax=Dyella silvatica TaxID=2992128 RepID=UPI0022559C46|nr:delta-60 repeat domain-containing protein [Dyella silvatica]